MDVSQFHELADTVLAQLEEAVELADEEGAVDFELQGGVLTLTLNDGNEYIINKHEPTQQIWLSSPYSGASHFSYDMAADEWRTADNELFSEIITDELARYAKVRIEL